MLRALFLLALPSAAHATAREPTSEAAAPVVAPASAESTEEVVDFEAEERTAESKRDQLLGAKGGPGAGGAMGFKLFVDLLLDYRVGEKTFQFRPNHTYVFFQASVYEDVQFMMHVSDAPIFFELTLNVLPRLSVTMGKLLVPYGTNEFHHIIGGRVDELSHFLPETWSDYGVSVSHVLYDGDTLNLEYVAYALNGFKGVDEPTIAEGSPSDNNWSKALGARVRATVGGHFKVTGSVYYDVWDADDKHPALFYALGAELQPGWTNAPVLDRLRLRGEWSRGEVQLATSNYQKGIIRHAYARAGYYAEALYALAEGTALRLRVGRINPDNRVTDERDVEVYEPGILIGLGKKVWWTIAYQFTASPKNGYDPESPPDVAYAKVFLQY
jgi:hypothetical protein